MKTKILERFFNTLKEDHQCMLYSGNFNDDITDRVIQLSEYNVDNREEELITKKRVTYLLAECFQNIIRHGDFEENKNVNQETGFFMARSAADKYYITSGNLVDKQHVGNLEEHLKQVNSLNEEELKLLYRKVMLEGKISEKGGAGLGLIDMARKSGQQLGYQFRDFSTTHSLFYNQIILKSPKEQENITNDEFDIDFAIELHKKIVDEKIILLQKGDFSRESIIPVLKIMEQNVMSAINNSYLMKEVFHVMVELLQNISRHGFKTDAYKEGIFMLSADQKEFYISAGNYINNERIPSFNALLHKINSMSKEELRTAYIDLLRNGKETENGGAGIGLIDIARLSSDKFEFNFEKVDKLKSLFMITVRINTNYYA